MKIFKIYLLMIWIVFLFPRIVWSGAAYSTVEELEQAIDKAEQAALLSQSCMPDVARCDELRKQYVNTMFNLLFDTERIETEVHLQKIWNMPSFAVENGHIVGSHAGAVLISHYKSGPFYGSPPTSTRNITRDLEGTEITFYWEHLGYFQHRLQIGSEVGGNDLYDSGIINNYYDIVKNLPSTGQKIYIRLSTKINNNWVTSDSVHNAYRSDDYISDSNQDVRKNIAELYVAWFNRIPDKDGINYWVEQLSKGLSLENMSEQFYSSAINQFSTETGYFSSMTDNEFIIKLYEGVMGRTGNLAPNNEEIFYWKSKLNQDYNSNKGALVVQMIKEIKNFNASNNLEIKKTQDTFNNKVHVASSLDFEGSISQGKDILSKINDTTASVNAVLSNLETVDSRSAEEFFQESLNYYEKQNLYSKALESVEKSIVIEPNNDKYLAYAAHYAWLTWYETKNNKILEKGLEYGLKALSINNSIAWYHVAVAWNAYKLEKMDIAKKYANSALKFGKDVLGKANYDAVLIIINDSDDNSSTTNNTNLEDLHILEVVNADTPLGAIVHNMEGDFTAYFGLKDKKANLITIDQVTFFSEKSNDWVNVYFDFNYFPTKFEFSTGHIFNIEKLSDHEINITLVEPESNKIARRSIRNTSQRKSYYQDNTHQEWLKENPKTASLCRKRGKTVKIRYLPESYITGLAKLLDLLDVANQFKDFTKDFVKKEARDKMNDMSAFIAEQSLDFIKKEISENRGDIYHSNIPEITDAGASTAIACAPTIGTPVSCGIQVAKNIGIPLLRKANNDEIPVQEINQCSEAEKVDAYLYADCGGRIINSDGEKECRIDYGATVDVGIFYYKPYPYKGFIDFAELGSKGIIPREFEFEVPADKTKGYFKLQAKHQVLYNPEYWECHSTEGENAGASGTLWGLSMSIPEAPLNHRHFTSHDFPKELSFITEGNGKGYIASVAVPCWYFFTKE